MNTVAVEVSGSAYEVWIELDLLSRAGERLRRVSGSSRVAIVTDSHVGPLYLDALKRSCGTVGIEVIAVSIPAGEEHKTLATAELIYDRLLATRIDRATPILALGGGVVGDVAGFVAATVLRGVPFVQVPTTLLAMVDASVGGKTGVNHARGKNLIGAFHQPRAVLIDPRVLKTLPQSELRNGLAECIKHDLIRDAGGFARLEREIDRALRLDIDYLAELIAHNLAIKARVVADDPFEQGERAHLNFGHTFGHAIESVTDFAVAHGEAVALGMVAASHLSMKLNLLDAREHERIVALIARAGLPTRGLGEPTDALLDAMRRDKKIASGRARFVVLDGIGRAVVRDDVPEELVREAIEALRG